MYESSVHFSPIGVNLLLHECGDVGVVNLLLLIGQGFELLEDGVELLAGEGVAHRLGAIGQRRPAAVLAHHQVAGREADVLGMHDLVGRSLLEHSVLVDAGLVGEGVLADDRLVALHVDAGDVGRQPAGGHQAWRVDARGGAVVIAAGSQGHDDLFQRAIAGPFAQPVDRTLDLARRRLRRPPGYWPPPGRGRCGNEC